MMLNPKPRVAGGFPLTSIIAGTLGASAILTQLVFMREFLSVFSGNEIIFGITLGIWLLLTGIGTSIGRVGTEFKEPMTLLISGLMVLSFIPVISIFLLRTIRDVVFIRGAAVGLTEAILSCTVLLLPYCLLSGGLLTISCSASSSNDGPRNIGWVYFSDNVGSIIGGFFFTFVLVTSFSHFGILYAQSFATLAVAGIASWHRRQKLLVFMAGLILAALIGIATLTDMDSISTGMQYPGQTIAFAGNSAYGRLIVTELDGQLNFIENGIPLFASSNIQEIEESVHYAMAQRPSAGRVLILAGGVSGTAREVLKYGTGEVASVEIDPLVLKVGRKFFRNNVLDPRIRLIQMDGRMYLKQAKDSYDVIISEVPDPTTCQLNRYFTIEFFQEVKRALMPGGVLSISMGHYENYVNPELSRSIAALHHTLAAVFKNVMMIPGGKIYFLASDGEMTKDISTRLAEHLISPVSIRRDYIQEVMRPDRLLDINRAIAEKAPLNTDFYPILYYYRLIFWMNQFDVQLGFLLALLIALTTPYLLKMRAIAFAIFVSGFAASALEIVLLIFFQVLFGSLYQQIGLIMTVFMTGLAIGSFVVNRLVQLPGRRHVAVLAFCIALFALILPIVLKWLSHIQPWTTSITILGQAVFAFLTLLLALLVGMQFPAAARTGFETTARTAARMYTADFIGAFLGASIFSSFVIPRCGVTTACLVIAGMIIVSGFVVGFKRGV